MNDALSSLGKEEAQVNARAEGFVYLTDPVGREDHHSGIVIENTEED